MSVTVDSVVARVRRLIDEEPLEDYLSGACTVTGVQGQLDSSGISVLTPSLWAVGDIIEFRDSSYEQTKIHPSWNGSTTGVPAIRGHNDTTPTTHATGTTIYKNPRIAGQDIADAINNTLTLMWPQAWAVSTLTISGTVLQQGQQIYDLSSGATGVSGVTGTYTGDLNSVTQDATTTSGAYRLYQYGYPGETKPVGMKANLPSTISSSGFGLYLPNVYSTTVPVVVNYCRYLTNADIQDGLMADTIAFGAAARVLAMRQIVRSGQDVRQGEPGSVEIFLQDTQYFETLYQNGLRRLYLQLMADPRTRKMPRWDGP